MTEVRSPLRARYRESWKTGRLASGFVSGALLGFVCLELGIRITGWDFSTQDMLIFALLAAALSIFGRLMWALWIADIVLFLIICVIALTPLTPAVTRRLVRADSLPPGGVDAVVVLSSSVTSSGTLQVEGSDRLLAGLELMRAGAAPRLMTTQVRAKQYGEITSDADQRRLIRLAGVADRWLVTEGSVYTTRDEVMEVDRKLRQLGALRIAVVTSPLHTRRACAAFERDGMRVICRPAPERGEQTLEPRNTRDRLAAFRAYVYERLGWMVYRSRGWVKG